ncbi:hypothetical protein AQUCO_00100729v1 [Aquilegia coerulea]|uniref:BAH domain-containing protein n=1 Tax=Aquilegia coerulea TaxID=218851 RepID=A0A2G5FBS1_AQUCA|nr:hypothetical protein AQUCO_00100729v1 [Aquilegia coerulea]
MSGSNETEKPCYFRWGVKGENGKRPGVQFYKSFTYDGVDYCLHDCVYLYNEKRPNEPHIGKLVKIWRDASKNANRVKILWFFRPWEIQKYLNSDVLKNEIFLASGEGEGVDNVNDLDVLVGKCIVVCVSKDERNPQPSAEELKRAHYIFRRTFDVGKFRISDKIGDSVAGTKIVDIFNKKRSPQFANAPKLPSNLIKSSSLSRSNSVKTVGKEGKYENASCIAVPVGKGREQTLFKNTTGSKGFNADNNRFQPNSKRDCNNLLASSINAARKYASLHEDLSKTEVIDVGKPTKANVPQFESKSNAYGVQKSGSCSSNVKTEPYGSDLRSSEYKRKTREEHYPLEDRLRTAWRNETLVLFENLDPSYTSKDIKVFVPL